MQYNQLQFEQLFQQHHKALLAYAYLHVKNVEAAEDIVQDVFFNLWRRKEFVDDEHIKAYLFRATYTRSLNYLSNKNNTNLRINSTEQRLEAHLKTGTNLEEALLSNELQCEIRLSVDLLPAHCQKIFLLRQINNLKNAEIAERLGVSVKAVEKQITKALQHIRIHLKKRGYL